MFLFVGAILFVYLVGVSWTEMEEDLAAVHLGPLAVLVVIGVPLTVLTLILEYRLSARCIGILESFPRSVGVALASALANMLPLPGALLIKAGALRQAGASLSRAATLSALGGLLWLLYSCLLVGGVLLIAPRGSLAPGAILLIAGAAGLVVVIVVIHIRIRPPGWPLAWLLVTILAKALVAGLTTYLAIQSFRGPITFLSSLVLSAAIPLASAAGVFPGGLGLRELLSAWLAPFAGVQPEIAVLGSAVSRVAFLVGLGMLWLVTFIRSHNRLARDASSAVADVASGSDVESN